jgi:hypothetical protein
MLMQDAYVKGVFVPGASLNQQAWTSLAGTTSEIFTSARMDENFENDESNPFKQLSTYLRVVLQYSTLIVLNFTQPFTIRRRAIESLVTRLRAPETVDWTKLSISTKFWVESFIYNAEKNFGPEGTASGKALLKQD